MVYDIVLEYLSILFCIAHEIAMARAGLQMLCRATAAARQRYCVVSAAAVSVVSRRLSGGRNRRSDRGPPARAPMQSHEIT